MCDEIVSAEILIFFLFSTVFFFWLKKYKSIVSWSLVPSIV